MDDLAARPPYDSSDEPPGPVHFAGPWTTDEQALVEGAAQSAESTAQLPAVPSGVRPWAATKHILPSFTLVIASRLRTDDVLTASGAEALAAHIRHAPLGHRAHDDLKAPPSVFQLVYQSEAHHPMTGDDLHDLLLEARAKNKRLGITGVLLYNGLPSESGVFLQVLEGEEDTVRSLYGTICDDPRHQGVETLLTTRVPHRVFPDWTMGLDDLAHATLPPGTPAATSFLQSGDVSTEPDLLPPVARAIEQFKRLTDPAAHNGSARSYRLLVVENSRVTQRLLQLIFEGETHSVDIAQSVDEALFKAEDNVYDVFALDIDLGERRTGVEVLHTMHRMDQHENVPAVAVTTYPMKRQETIFREMGFSSVVTKPVTKHALLNGIEEAIRNPAPPDPSSAERYEDIALPPLPSTIPKLLTLIAQGNPQESDYERLIAILSRDQVLATWLIRTANSAFFKLSASVESVEGAIHYLGFRSTCNLLLGRLLADRFAGFASDREEAVYSYIMRLGLGAAHLTRTIAERLEYPHPEVAHSAVLITQLGRLVLLDKRGETYAALWFEDGAFVGPPPIGQETLALSTNYVSEGLTVGHQNELSSTLLQVIRHHHQPAHARGKPQKLLAHMVALGLEIYVAMVDQPMNRLQRILLNSYALDGIMDLTGSKRRDLMRATHEALESARAFVDEVLT